MRVLIIVPAYNEQEAIAGVLDELKAVRDDFPGADILVVDDGSADRTAEVARAGGARVLRLSRNLGIGGAVQAGLRVAHRDGFDYAVQIDGDGQHPPHQLRELFAAVDSGADLVVGTRYRNGIASARGDHERFQSTLLRRLGSWWLRQLLRVLGGVDISDPTSGFRVYGPRALALFDTNYPYDFPEPESLAVARAQGLTVVEVPVVMRPRQGGSSSITGLSGPYYMLKVTIAIVLTYLRTKLRSTRVEVDSDA